MKIIAIFGVLMAVFIAWINQLPSPERRYNAEHDETYTLWDGDKSTTFKVSLLQPEPLGDEWTIADESQLRTIMQNLPKSGFKPSCGMVIVSSSAHLEAYHGYKTLFRDVYRCVNNKGDVEPDVIASESLKKKSPFMPNGWRIIAIKRPVVGDDFETLASTSLQ